MDQHSTPIFTALREHASKSPVQFHIPGHNKGAGMDSEFSSFIGQNVLSMDLITIAPLDDPHRPMGIIKEAQQLAAQAFGADFSFFCVEGTSGAIRCMIASVCSPGDKILVPRNVHKSVLGGVIFCGAIPVFMMPDLDHEFGIAHGVSIETVRDGLDQNPDVKGVLVINPTYFGVCADLKAIVELAHSRKVPVLVDEAHGAHLNFCDKLPISAMQAGADIAATSIHKLGGSMTQSSLLNVKEGLVSARRVFSVLTTMMTTSPSYILMASLDVARRNLYINGDQMLTKAIDLAQDYRSRLNNIPGISCFGEEILGKSSSRFALDPTKLCINVKDLAVTGIQVEGILRIDFGIEVEMSTMYSILCIVSIGTVEEDLLRLETALQSISERYSERANESKPIRVCFPNMIPNRAMSPRDAFFAETETVPIHACAGEVVAETVTIYPPGIPILLPGEVIMEENIKYLLDCAKSGLSVQGTQDAELATLKVVKRKTITLDFPAELENV
jgi:arginine decarboxylase